ncbi:hypothetical protein VE02_04080 [Pseudogymnoascus sp. 03VT05]|nr:hypothetical protein VE02_04080 [Pseudogymnoascus sp. 03VT05]
MIRRREFVVGDHFLNSFITQYPIQNDDTDNGVVEESQEPAPPEYEPGIEPTPPEYDPRTEPLPEYSGELSGLESILHARRNSNATLSRDDRTWDLETWRQYVQIYPRSTKSWDERDAKENAFAASSLFLGINLGKDDVIAFLIENGIDTPNTKLAEETPLLRAVAKTNVRVVKQLLGLGAEKDAISSASTYYDSDEGTVHVFRTPLQQAASLGHLVLVKLVMETYHCDDSLVAPDGQTALRLAAENRHHEVVDYLPSRRSGGFRRWKHTHRKSKEYDCQADIKELCMVLENSKGFWPMVQASTTEPTRKGCTIWEEDPAKMGQKDFDLAVETGLRKITESPRYPGTMNLEHHYLFRKGSLECHLEDSLALVNSGGGRRIISSESYAD